MKKYILTILFSILSIGNLVQAKNETKEPDSYAYNRGKEAFNEEKYADAMDWFNKELSDHPDNGYAYIYISALRIGNNEYGKALSAVNQALKKLPKKDKEYTAVAYATRAKLYLVMEDTISALKDYDMTIKLEPQNEKHYENRAQLYFDQRRYDLADADYQKIISIDPGEVMGYMGIGRNAKEQKRYDEALERFNYVIKMEPDYDSGYSFRAECYIAQKKYSEALDDIIKALSISGDRKAFYLLATMDEDALPIIKAKLQVQANKNPNDAEWHYYLGQVFERHNRMQDAISFYEQAHVRDANAAFLERISGCYFELGDYDSALDYVDQAIYIDSNDYDLVILKGNIYNEMGRSNDAIAELNKYITKYPDSAYAHYLRGWFKEVANDYDGAVDDYTMAITLDPQSASVYCLRGKFYERQGKKELAKADFEKVIELDPVPKSQQSSAPFALYYLGDKDKAVEFMDSVLEKNENRAESYYDAACLYSIMGEKEKAIDFLQKAFEQGYRRIASVHVDHDFDNIREMPEYKDLLEKYSNKKLDGEIKSQNEVSDYDTEIVEVPFTKEGGVTKVKCSINGLPLHFVFDTGAADVTMSMVEANFMLKNDYIKPTDIIGSARYINANGDISEGTVVNLRNVNFGGLELENVRASVVRNQVAPLLLGQSVLGRLGKIEIDNPNMKLVITHKSLK